jgi:hypothetical protein
LFLSFYLESWLTSLQGTTTKANLWNSRASTESHAKLLRWQNV